MGSRHSKGRIRASMERASLRSPKETSADNKPAPKIHWPVTEDPFLQMKKYV